MDFLPAKAMTPEQFEEQQKRIAEMAKKTRKIDFEVDGEPAQFEIFFANTIPTNGGLMYDLTIMYEELETRHRMILGKEYYEQFNMDPQQCVVMAFTFLLQKKEPRHTEGVVTSPETAASIPEKIVPYGKLSLLRLTIAVKILWLVCSQCLCPYNTIFCMTSILKSRTYCTVLLIIRSATFPFLRLFPLQDFPFNNLPPCFPVLAPNCPCSHLTLQSDCIDVFLILVS